MDLAGNIGENKSKWFEHVGEINNDSVVEKIVEIRVGRNWEKGRSKMKWTDVIRE